LSCSKADFQAQQVQRLPLGNHFGGYLVGVVGFRVVAGLQQRKGLPGEGAQVFEVAPRDLFPFRVRLQPAFPLASSFSTSCSPIQ
jgi:hypothetical protein